jgi:hypothetical protein
MAYPILSVDSSGRYVDNMNKAIIAHNNIRIQDLSATGN